MQLLLAGESCPVASQFQSARECLPAAPPAREESKTMPLSAYETERFEHPLDIVERLASSQEWAFDRAGDDEISISVEGGWAPYNVAFTWLEDLEALHVACAFDLKVPERRRAETTELTGLINEQLWVGHFDIWRRENVVMFRHALLLQGGLEPSRPQCEGLLNAAVQACERYFQAFQFVAWAGRPARESLDCVMFDTAGEA